MPEAFAQMGGRFPGVGVIPTSPMILPNLVGNTPYQPPSGEFVRHQMMSEDPQGFWQAVNNLFLGRPLTQQEQDYFAPLYGRGGNLENVRVHNVPWQIKNYGGFVFDEPGLQNQVWLMPGASEDVLVHEIAHTAQGPTNIFADPGYDVSPEAIGSLYSGDPAPRFHDLGPEQQAEVLRRYYELMTRTGRRPTGARLGVAWSPQERTRERQQQELELWEPLVREFQRGVR